MFKVSNIFWIFLICITIFRIISTYSKYNHFEYKYFCIVTKTSELGIIISNPSFNDTSQSFVIKSISGCLKDESIKIKTKIEPRYSMGETIRFTGKVLRPANFSNSKDQHFDYIGYLAKDNIHYEIKSAEIERQSNTKDMSGNSNFLASLYNYFEVQLSNLRNSLIRNIRLVLGEPHASLASGLILGEKSSLGKDLLDDFRKAGLIHIVVLSGFNITIVGEIIKKLLSRLKRGLSMSLGAFAIFSFAIMVGGGATVVRSTIMALIQYFASYIRRDYKVDRALYFAGIAMIIQNPLILTHDPSFHLSFLATLGLIYLAKPMNNMFSWITDKFQLRDMISTTISTQIFVTPYIVFLMGTISLSGLVTNILILPIIPLTMAIVSIISLFGFVSTFVSQFLAYFAHIILSYELFIVKLFAHIPIASIYTGTISFKTMICLYILLAIIIYTLYTVRIQKDAANNTN